MGNGVVILWERWTGNNEICVNRKEGQCGSRWVGCKETGHEPMEVRICHIPVLPYSAKNMTSIIIDLNITPTILSRMNAKKKAGREGE